MYGLGEPYSKFAEERIFTKSCHPAKRTINFDGILKTEDDACAFTADDKTVQI